LSDNIYIALFTSGYTPNRGTHDFYDDTSAGSNEVANGSGYTTNGILQSNKTLAIGSNIITFDNTVDPAWTSATFSCTQAVLVDRTPGTDATRPLIGYIDFGATASPSNGTLTIAYSGSGIVTITNA